MRFYANHIDATFTPNELKRSVPLRIQYANGLNIAAFERASKEFHQSSYQVKKIGNRTLGKHLVFFPQSHYDQICLCRTAKILNSTIRPYHPNRNSLVRQLIQILSSEDSCGVMRSDIRSFYSSVNFEEIIGKLEVAGFRNSCVLAYLRSLSNYIRMQYNYFGLPRGLSLSAPLAEFALSDFDYDILANEDVLFYARYVDDICLLYNRNGTTLHNSVTNALPSGMELNGRKTKHLSKPVENLSKFEYLGYDINPATNYLTCSV